MLNSGIRKDNLGKTGEKLITHNMQKSYFLDA